MSGEPRLDREGWRKVEALLDRALELPAPERRAWLAREAGGDPGLRSEVEALLDADEEAGDFLARPATEAAADLLAGEPTAQALPGSRVGPYRLRREIGAGGMGVVYEAEDPRLARRVALKLLPAAWGRDRVAKERFLREARIAAGLDHPNISTVHDVGEHDGRLYLVMALYEGETLRERLARGPLPVEEAVVVATGVARALARAHEAGIVHRDIKPGNVLLTTEGEVKVLDFGIAKARGDLTLTAGGAPGTPAYMAPEQGRGGPVDGRADLWSLGVVLYEMLTGERPFGGSSDSGPPEGPGDGKPETLERLRPEVPPALARAVAKLLRERPEERYPSARALLADLELGARAREGIGGRRAWALRWAPAAIGIAAVFAAGWRWGPALLAPAPPLRVAVLAPRIRAPAPAAVHSSLAAEVVDAALSTLIRLRGIQALDPPYRDEALGSPEERLRAAEADEALRPLLDCRADGCRVTLRRLALPELTVVGSAGPFEVEAGPESALRLAEAVQVHVQRVFPDHRPLSPSPGRRVREEDYAAFIALERQADAGTRLSGADLDRLDRLLRTSPDFLGAHLFAAGQARRLGELDRALGYATRALDLAPHDPRPLFARFRIELAGRRFEAAELTLAELARLAPSDLRLSISRADLAEARGDLPAARATREEVARRRPLWRHVLDLAGLEVRLGESATARRRLSGLLAANPDNLYVLQSLALLEAVYGDLGEAGRLYERLVGLQPERADWTNLGFVRYLKGDLAGAVDAARRALAMEPTHALTRFNLAAALEASGERPEAQAIYRALLAEPQPAPAGAHPRMLRAQCLVRTGRRAEGEALTEQVLAEAPDEVAVLHQAVQVYALLDRRVPALFYAERALGKGLAREWLAIPELAALESDPAWQALLAGEASRPAGE